MRIDPYGGVVSITCKDMNRLDNNLYRGDKVSPLGLLLAAVILGKD